MVEARNHREIPPIFRYLTPFQIRNFTESSLLGGSKGLECVGVVWLAYIIYIEYVVIAACISQDNVMLAVEGAADG